MDEKTIARFWAKVDKNGPVPQHRPELGQCWIWTAAKDRLGYGRLGVRWPVKRSVLAHRISYALNFGEIPETGGHHGTCVCHHCDNPSCVNPRHLFLGTMTDNMSDKVRKGRQARGDSSGARAKPESRPRGARHHNSKLSDEAVAEIRSAYGGRWADGPTLDSLAEKFGVSRSTVADAVKGACWKHVPGKRLETDARVKLSPADILEIKSMYRGKGNGPTQASIARMFGVTQARIGQIVSSNS